MKTIAPSFFRSWAFLLAPFLLATVTLAPSGAAAADPEIRAFWIEAWSSGIKTPTQVNQVIADVQAGNFNTIIPQVRRRADAFYMSNIEPRTNDPAVPSGYDPLADLIAKAHAANPPIEVHAWIVVYPIWRVGHSPHPDPGHIYNSHPEWLNLSNTGANHDGSNYQVDPGHPEAQQHTFDVAMDLLTNYDIDGLHYDYVRYSGRAWGYNPIAIERFNRIHNRSGTPATTDSEWLQFRRDQVTQLVRKIYLSAMGLRPELKISAATITWAPGPANLSEWYSSTSAYQHVLQDWRGWMEEGILDLNIPMAYFRESTHPHDWMKWINFAKDHRYNRHTAMGPGIWLNSIAETIKQFRDTRAPSPSGNVGQGVSGYSYQGTNNQGFSRSVLLNALTQPSSHDPIGPPIFAENAPIPEMPWKTDPQTGHLKGFVRTASDDQVADGAVVHLSGDAQRTVQADATGFYGFVDLAPGNYSVAASWDEFDGDTAPAPVSISKGEVTHEDLHFGQTAATILVHPQSQSVIEGTEVVFTVEAGGVPAPDYQWQFNGTNIDGEQSATLSLNSVQPGHAGDYRVIVSNSLDSVPSSIATLTIDRLPSRPGFTTVGIDAEGVLEAKLLSHPFSWFLVEASTDLASWLPLTTIEIAKSAASFVDPDWAAFTRRFYRAREVATHPLATFDLYANGAAAMFQNPGFSGSTSPFIETGDGLPNFIRVTNTFPVGIDASQVLSASWSFASGTTNPWLRLTTFNAPLLPNPIVNFSHGLRFNVYVDRSIYLAIGLRETNSTGPLGGDGGASGSIEFVGGQTDNTVRPPLGMFIPGGEWTTVHFFVPFEPISAFSNDVGNGILTSATGKGVLENLTIVPADGTGIYTLYLDHLRAIELLP